MKDKEKELTAVIETVLRETKNCDMSIETLTDYLVDRIKNKVIIEDSIILSRKEYEKLKYTWITDSDAYKKGCKEMAEKIYKLVDSKLDLYRNGVIGGTLYDRGYQIAISDIKQKIKDIFKVEIKE